MFVKVEVKSVYKQAFCFYFELLYLLKYDVPNIQQH